MTLKENSFTFTEVDGKVAVASVKFCLPHNQFITSYGSTRLNPGYFRKFSVCRSINSLTLTEVHAKTAVTSVTQQITEKRSRPSRTHSTGPAPLTIQLSHPEIPSFMKEEGASHHKRRGENSEVFLSDYSLSPFSISRKYLYVSTISSPQAASSQAMIAPLCI